MNILHQYTFQSLKVNRRRTLFTGMGIVISVAMITAVSVFASSFLDYMERKAIYETGDWELAYSDLNDTEIQYLNTDKQVDLTFTVDDLGYAVLPESQNEYKPYWFIRACDEEGFQRLGLHLVSGRLPENENELLVSEHVAYNGGVEIELGQTIALQTGQRVLQESPDQPLNQNNPYDPEQPETIADPQPRNYTVVGIMERSDLEPRWSPGYTAITARSETNPGVDPVVYVKLKHSGQRPQEDFPQLQIKLYPAAGVNNNVLRFRGPFWENSYFAMVASAATLTLFIIITGSVFLIYNAFAISLTERSRQFGILASVGATSRQKFWCVVQEGLMIALAAIPLGVLAGICGMAVTLRVINPMLQSLEFLSADVPFHTVVSFPAVVLTVLCSVVMIVLACWLPALKAARMTPIQAIRQPQKVKLKRRHRFFSFVAGKLWGVEGELAVKNIQRSGRKAGLTILSLAVSLILFTTVTSVMTMMIQAVGMTSQDELADAWVTDYSSHSFLEEKPSFTQLRQLTSVAGTQRITQVYAAVHTQNLDFDDYWSGIGEEYPALLFAVDDESYAQILAENQISEAMMADPADGVIPGILFNRYRAQITENGKKRYADVPFLKSMPETLKISIGDAGEMLMIKPMALAADMNLYSSEIVYGGNLAVLIPVSNLNTLLTEAKGSRSYSDKLYLRAVPGQQETMIQQIDEIGKQNLTHSFSWYSPVQNQREDKTLLTIVSIFIYGFITLICMICLVNVINTISTNIALRRKEFAMLRSVGMDEKKFNRMIRLESVFYGLGAAAIGIPVSLYLITLLHYNLMQGSFWFSFTMPWPMMLGGVAVLMLMVMTMMSYATRKVRKENIIETLKEEE